MTSTTRPLPSVVAPAPGKPVCAWCDGLRELPDDYGHSRPCWGCGGSGEGDWIPVAEFVLAPTRTHKKPGRRKAAYDANRSRLTLTQATKMQGYDVTRIEAAPEYGVALELVKDDGEVYHLRCGSAGVDCSCAGETYLASAKANQRAHEDGDDVYPTFGCVHLDACVPLVAAGWFDI